MTNCERDESRLLRSDSRRSEPFVDVPQLVPEDVERLAESAGDRLATMRVRRLAITKDTEHHADTVGAVPEPQSFQVVSERWRALLRNGGSRR